MEACSKWYPNEFEVAATGIVMFRLRLGLHMKKHFLKKGVYLNDFEATWIALRI